MKSALFVDFDNIYSSLRRLDEAAARQFATQPDIWVKWLNNTLRSPPHAPVPDGRRLLVRRCYLNPKLYQQFRLPFNRTGFEIVDCPPMTSEGKTSTDIHMVLDIVDLLQHNVHYDEFIVFSADADFTPVLRKLRRWDRRTTVLAVGFPSAAYRASADLLIDQDDFIRAGLGLGEEEAEPETTPILQGRAQPDVIRDATGFISRLVQQSPKAIALPLIASKLAQEVDGLDVATWEGYGSFRKLMDSWSTHLGSLEVDWETGTIRDPARHALPTRGKTAQADNGNKLEEIVRSVNRLIFEEMESTGRPVPCGRLAQLIVAKHSGMAADWGGKGSFRKFMDSLELGDLEIDWGTRGGIVLDPKVHRTPVPAKAENWGQYQHLYPIIQQIRQSTGMPLLSPLEIRGLLEALEAEVAMSDFALSQTSKFVRDRCRTAGLGISRADTVFVLKGILYGGHTFGSGNDTKTAFAKSFVKSMKELSTREQVEIDIEMERTLMEWTSADERAA